VLAGPVFDMQPKFAAPQSESTPPLTAWGGRTARESITFKQTPYALEV